LRRTGKLSEPSNLLFPAKILTILKCTKPENYEKLKLFMFYDNKNYNKNP
jgi:hypothetical protein